MITNEEKNNAIIQEISELIATYSGLSYWSDDNGNYIVFGKLIFKATYNEKSIKEEYDVEIIINDKYPDSLPSVKEIGHRIPRDFHQYKEEGLLCLGAPLDMKRQFNKKRTLLGFVENLIIPYLYSYSIKENKGIMPYGELSHGVEGILESYKELLGIDNDFVVLRFLKILSDDNYRGHIDCPCGSNKKLRNCHGNILINRHKPLPLVVVQ